MPAHRPTLHLFSICVLIWGSTWLAITWQLGPVAPEMSVGYRFILAALVVFGFCRWQGINLKYGRREHLDFALLGGAMFCTSYIMVYYAETFIVSGMVAVGYSASPMINIFLARLCFGTPMTLKAAVASLFGMVGIAFVFWPEFGHLGDSRNAALGAATTMLSVVLSSVGSMAAIRNKNRGYPVWSSMGWAMLYGGLFSIAIGLVLGKPLTMNWSAGYLLSLFYLAVFGSVITFACYLTLIGRIGAAGSGYIGVMVPIVALTVSYFFEHFEWGWLTTVGVVLSVIGNIIMLRPDTKKAV